MKIIFSVKENRIIDHNEHSEINVEDELFSTLQGYNKGSIRIECRQINPTGTHSQYLLRC